MAPKDDKRTFVVLDTGYITRLLRRPYPLDRKGWADELSAMDILGAMLERVGGLRLLAVRGFYHDRGLEWGHPDGLHVARTHASNADVIVAEALPGRGRLRARVRAVVREVIGSDGLAVPISKDLREVREHVRASTTNLAPELRKRLGHLYATDHYDTPFKHCQHLRMDCAVGGVRYEDVAQRVYIVVFDTESG